MVNTTNSGRPGNLQIVFLTALVYNPVVLVLWLLYSYSPASQCYVGAFCAFDQFTGILQLFYFVLGLVITGLLVALALRLLTMLGIGNGWLNSWMQFEELRGVSMTYGLVLSVLLVVAIATGRAPLLTVVLALLTDLLVCALTLVRTPRAALRQPPIARVTPISPNTRRQPAEQAASPATPGAAADTVAEANANNVAPPPY